MKFENCKYDHLQLADQFLKMAEKFIPYAKNESNHVNMMCATTIVHSCGTVACHAGYAGLALSTGSDFYYNGATALAKFLGFKSMTDLRNWAANNDLLWGGYGGSMFTSRRSFGVDLNKPIDMTHIIKKYLDVAERLMEIKS